MRVNLLVVLTAIAAVLYLISWFAGPRGDEELSGRARVIDGDTIEITGQRIRIFGIDAPEQEQTCQRTGGATWECGAEATRLMRQIAGFQIVECRVRTTDIYGRRVARCRVGDADLGRAMVRSGFAISASRERAYRQEETMARSGRLGIWSGSFQNPRDWRNAHHNGARE